MIWVLFYIFAAILLAAGAFMAWRGIRGASRAHTGLFQKFAGVSLAVIGLLLIAASLAVVDMSGSYIVRKHVSDCKKRLGEVYLRIDSYVADHNGEMPESLREMADAGYLIERDLVCPVVENLDDGSDEAEGPSYYYNYHKPEDADGEEVMVYDNVPHVVPHKLFKFLEMPRYNVLRSNGDVEAIGEEELKKELGGAFGE